MYEKSGIVGIIKHVLVHLYLLIRWRKQNVKFPFSARIDRISSVEGYNRFSHKCRFSGHLGKYSYIGENSIIYGDVGRFCSIGSDVRVLIGTHPVNSFVSTHPVFFSLRKQCGITFAKAQEFNEILLSPSHQYPGVSIGNDVWIGSNAVIIGGIKIGDGAIIAAGSLVTKEVSPYSIVGGNPARHIKYRFGENEIERLLDLKWWEKPNEWLQNNVNYFKSIGDFSMFIGGV